MTNGQAIEQRKERALELMMQRPTGKAGAAPGAAPKADATETQALVEAYVRQVDAEKAALQQENTRLKGQLSFLEAANAQLLQALEGFKAKALPDNTALVEKERQRLEALTKQGSNNLTTGGRQ